jgi:hypothetical protein
MLQAKIDALNIQHNKELSEVRASQAPKLRLVDKAAGVSYMTSAFLPFYILSWLGYFAHKLPFLWRLAPFATKFVAKSTLLASLILFRKAFIVFNAIIGMAFVLKLGVLDNGSIFSNISMIGNTYLELFGNFVAKVFSVIVEFFDYKVTPIDTFKPGPTYGPSSTGYGWYTNPMSKNSYLEMAEAATKWHKNPFSSQSILDDPTPWY